jgi:hypothetical protein
MTEISIFANRTQTLQQILYFCCGFEPPPPPLQKDKNMT